MRQTLASIVLGICVQTLAIPFQNMRLDHNIDTQSMDIVSHTIGETNETLRIGKVIGGHPTYGNFNGIIFDIYDEGELRFMFNELPDGVDPMDKIFVNGRKMSDIMAEKAQSGIEQSQHEATSNIVRQMTYNPLWGKKLAVIGDSLTCTPSKDKSYGGFIAKRNNMVLVHNGRSGEKLCIDRTNELGKVTSPSTIKSYTNDIPSDADFILVQIGTNDAGDWWARDEGLNIPDTDMTTNTFKGCWNNLLIGLKTYYPNAKVGMILPHCWKNNVGTNSEDAISTGTTRRMSDWQKAQCHRLSIPVFDPVVDSRMVLWNSKSYPTNGTDITSSAIQDTALDWFE